MKFFNIVAVVCLVQITGCAIQSTKPSELRNEITPIEYRSVKSSKIVARCVELEWKKFGYSGLKVLSSPTTNGYSVWGEFNWSKNTNPFIVKDHTVFLADIYDNKRGSIAHFYTHNEHGFTKSICETVWEKCINDAPTNTITTLEPLMPKTSTRSSAISDHNMDCLIDMDCSAGFSCRSKTGGGTECRAKGFSNTQQPPTEQAKAVEQSTPATPSPIAEPSKQPIQSKSTIEEVKYTKSGGVYLIPVLINDVLQMKFVVDSGAADVNISPDVYLTLLKTGTIKKRDSLPGQHYRLADGSIVKSGRFIIRTLKIGNRVLKNVTCSISDSIDADMLLGQSALEQLGNFTFHHETGTVRFNK